MAVALCKYLGGQGKLSRVLETELSCADFVAQPIVLKFSNLKLISASWDATRTLCWSGTAEGQTPRCDGL